LRLAASDYRQAFQADPKPDLALKLGELYWQNDKLDEARGWWMRHLRDAPKSKANDYIVQTLKTAAAMPSVAPQ
jgi:serine/threonine-protein kinase